MKREKNATYSPFPKVRAAQKDNERWLLRRIKSVNRTGALYNPTCLLTTPGFNALDRLEARGLVKFRKYIFISGYIATALVGKVRLALCHRGQSLLVRS